MPTSSGNGEFTVKDLFVGEKISIVASKMDYGSNSTKINNDKVIDLMNANQDRRDIPLKMELPPCNASSQNKSSVQAGSVSTQSYNMGMNSGTFEITYDTGSSCTDCIEIYSHKPGENYLSGERVFSSGQVATDGKKTATVTLAVPRNYKNMNGEYDTDFLECTLWTNVAENTTEYCQTGDMVGVKGRIQTRIIQSEDGTRKKKTEIVAEKVTFLAQAPSEKEAKESKKDKEKKNSKE